MPAVYSSRGQREKDAIAALIRARDAFLIAVRDVQDCGLTVDYEKIEATTLGGRCPGYILQLSVERRQRIL